MVERQIEKRTKRPSPGTGATEIKMTGLPGIATQPSEIEAGIDDVQRCAAGPPADSDGQLRHPEPNQSEQLMVFSYECSVLDASSWSAHFPTPHG